MNIEEAIVHRFQKERHLPSVPFMRSEVLPPEDNLTELVEAIRGVFNRVTNRGYGAFQEDTIAFPFSAQLNDYVSHNRGLVTFTFALQASYQKCIDAAQLSTGGHLFFARYKENDQDFLFIISLKLKEGTGIDDATLTLKKTINFDIDHLHEAARINLTAWKKADSERYITFVKRRQGKDSKSATDYFREFLGVTELTESSEQTKILLNALRDYCSERRFDPDKTREMRKRVHAYCVECTKEKKGINLDALSIRINDQEPDDFSQFLISKEYPLGDGFEPNSRVYRSLRRYNIKDSKLTLDFEESILGSRIIFNEEDETLTIRDLPTDFKQRLKATIPSNSDDST
ncbi:MAG: nucleoid-associated protein [Methylobacter sp.]